MINPWRIIIVSCSNSGFLKAQFGTVQIGQDLYENLFKVVTRVKDTDA
jgi:hypothetical protein